MATLRTVTVKTAAGDYTTLALAEAGEQGNLVSLDRQLDIVCDAMNDSGACTFDGWTCDSTRYIRVVAASGQRHAGVFDTSKYRRGALTTFEDFQRFEYLQFTGTDASLLLSSVSGFRVFACIFSGVTSNFGHCIRVANGATATIWGCVFENNGGADVKAIRIDASCTARLYNLSIRGVNTNGDLGVLMNGNGTVVCRNVVVWNTAGACWSNPGGGSITNHYCKSDDTTADDFSGANNTANVASLDSSFVDPTNRDLHLQSGDTVLKDAGSDLSSDPDSTGVAGADLSLDVDGATRSGTWDIGADEVTGGGGGGVTYPMLERGTRGAGRGVGLASASSGGGYLMKFGDRVITRAAA